MPPNLRWALHCPSEDRCRARHCAFVLAIWESWTWAKHGRAAPPFYGVFRQRLRHMAIRDRRVAALEEALDGR